MLNTALALAITSLAQVGSGSFPFKPGDEAIVYKYNVEAERKDTISSHPVATGWFAYQEVEKAAGTRNLQAYKDLEKRGELFWVLGGTRCRIIESQKGGTLGEIRIRDAYQVKFLNGDHRDKIGWILASLLRHRPRIIIDPPEPITEENRDNPAFLALMIQAQDKVAYREIRSALAKAEAAARTLPKGNPRRQARHDQVFRRELKTVLDRYDLDEATAFHILDLGKKGDWPAREEPKTPTAR